MEVDVLGVSVKYCDHFYSGQIRFPEEVQTKVVEMHFTEGKSEIYHGRGVLQLDHQERVLLTTIRELDGEESISDRAKKGMVRGIHRELLRNMSCSA